VLLHGRKSISRHCIRNSSLSFVQQSLKQLLLFLHRVTTVAV
jgi:hypothetical protein